MADTGLDLALLKSIDRKCESFERAWNSGKRPAIEEFLKKTPPSHRIHVWRELLLIELERLRSAGESGLLDDYRKRFPAYEAHLNVDWFSPGRADELSGFLRPDQYVGSFQLIRELGRGGFGVVWLANDTVLRRDVALKFLFQRNLQSHDCRRLIHEARLSARLDHDSIVRILGVGSEQEVDYVVSQYVEGLSLKTWRIARHPDFIASAAITAKIAEAIHYAHSQGIVHRDLKPGNILVDSEDVPHVMDFGLAKQVDAISVMTLSGQIVGTVGYMSPEQAAGKAAQADKRSDVYSLGVILYELLTGRVPFQGSLWEVVLSTLQCDPDPPRVLSPSVPRPLETVCLKALRRDPEKRYQTAAALADDLKRFVASMPVSARPPAIWERFQLNRRSALGLAGTISAGILVGSALNWRSSRGVPAASGNSAVRNVIITTKPMDKARVAIVPIDDITEAFRIDAIIHPEGTTPLSLPLPPGDYLIVAKLDERRFHEVYRHVPRLGESMGNYAHQKWTEIPDKDVIELPPIVIHDMSLAAEMVLIPEIQSFEMGVSGSLTLPIHRRHVPSFYIDAIEFTERDCKSVDDGRLPMDQRFVSYGDDHAIMVPFDLATRLAERVGKRLPDEIEYERAATIDAKRAFRSSEAVSKAGSRVATVFGPVGMPVDDVVHVGNQAIFGLTSNVAEWTASCPTSYPVGNAPASPLFDFGVAKTMRIVRGGNPTLIDGALHVDEKSRDPRQRVAFARSNWNSGIGFRCVRSANPRWERRDFSQPITEPL